MGDIFFNRLPSPVQCNWCPGPRADTSLDNCICMNPAQPSPDIRNPARKNSNTKRITHIIKHFTVHLFAKVYTLQALAGLDA